MKSKEVQLHMIDLQSLRKPTYQCKDTEQVYISIQAIQSVREIDLNVRTIQNRIKNNISEFVIKDDNDVEINLIHIGNEGGTRPRPYVIIDRVDEFIEILENVTCVIK